MSSDIITAGSRRYLTAVFTDKESGDAYDPDEVHLAWLRPDTGLEVHRQYGVAAGDQNIEKVATGSYRCPVLLDSYTLEVADWHFRWYSVSDDEDEAHNSGFVRVHGGKPPPAS